MKNVVIAGGGFAGVRTARRLRKQKGIQITLISDSDEFRYNPALYRAATGYKMGVARLHLEWMLLDSSNIELVEDRVAKIDSKERFIQTESGDRYSYDYAVLGLGSVTTYFNVEGMHEHSFGVKSVDEITELRQHLHRIMTTEGAREHNYVIVGAGPTGVELAGAFGSYVKRIAKKHRVRNFKATIWLVEAAPRILPMMNERVSRIVYKRLTKLGVKIAVDTKVQAASINRLKTSIGEIDTHTVLWTAGTANSPFYDDNADQFEFSEHHRIKVDKYLQGCPRVYVLGDNAAVQFAGTAQAAVRHATHTAKDIIARTRGKRRKPFRPSPLVSVVPVGRGWSIMQYRRLVLHGRPISLLRLLADYVGYSEVMGLSRALTVWLNSYVEEDGCRVCLTGRHRRRRK